MQWMESVAHVCMGAVVAGTAIITQMSGYHYLSAPTTRAAGVQTFNIQHRKEEHE